MKTVITECATIPAKLKRQFASLDDFLKRWNGGRKQAVFEELETEGLQNDHRQTWQGS
jgi:hypothetical protein